MWLTHPRLSQQIVSSSPGSGPPSLSATKKCRHSILLTQATNPPASPPPKTQLAESSQGRASSPDRHPTAKCPHQYFLEECGHQRNSKIGVSLGASGLEKKEGLGLRRELYSLYPHTRICAPELLLHSQVLKYTEEG